MTDGRAGHASSDSHRCFRKQALARSAEVGQGSIAGERCRSSERLSADVQVVVRSAFPRRARCFKPSRWLRIRGCRHRPASRPACALSIFHRGRCTQMRRRVCIWTVLQSKYARLGPDNMTLVAYKYMLLRRAHEEILIFEIRTHTWSIAWLTADARSSPYSEG